jgi:cation diffusion facilitator family transporter
MTTAADTERVHRRLAHRAIVISAIGLAATGAIELAIAGLTGSVALLGDALHNLADVSTSLVVFVGFLVSRRPPTPRHPYGYERAEDLAGLGVAAVIWSSAVFAGYESYAKLVSHGGTTHVGAGCAGAAAGLIGNLLVSRYKARIARRIHSTTLAADAKHSWLDMLSSVGALVGLAGVALGYRWADPVAGAVVTLFICHVGFEVTAQVVHHLLDGVEPDDMTAARAASLRIAGVHDASVRGRWMGRSLVVEIEGEIAGDTPLDAVLEIGREVDRAVRTAVPHVRAVHWLARPRRRT